MTLRRIALLALAAVVGAVVYATAAPAGQQAGPSRAEFNALKKRVTKVEKDTNAALVVLAGCLQRGVPVARYNGYLAVDSNGAQGQTTALDVADDGTTPQAYLLDIGQTCASAIQHTLGIKLVRVRPFATQRLQR
jgi:hypothetical protein